MSRDWAQRSHYCVNVLIDPSTWLQFTRDSGKLSVIWNPTYINAPKKGHFICALLLAQRKREDKQCIRIEWQLYPGVTEKQTMQLLMLLVDTETWWWGQRGNSFFRTWAGSVDAHAQRVSPRVGWPHCFSMSTIIGYDHRIKYIYIFFKVKRRFMLPPRTNELVNNNSHLERGAIDTFRLDIYTCIWNSHCWWPQVCLKVKTK